MTSHDRLVFMAVEIFWTGGGIIPIESTQVRPVPWVRHHCWQPLRFRARKWPRIDSESSESCGFLGSVVTSTDRQLPGASRHFSLEKIYKSGKVSPFLRPKNGGRWCFPLKNWVIQFEVPCSFCRVYTPSLPQKGKKIVSQTKIRTFDVDFREGTTTKLVGGWTNPSEKHATVKLAFPQFSGWFSQKYLSCHHLYSWVVFLWMGVGLFVDWREGAWSLLWFSHWFSRPSGCNHSNDLGKPWGSDFSGPVSEGDDENGFEEACIYSRLD